MGFTTSQFSTAGGTGTSTGLKLSSARSGSSPGDDELLVHHGKGAARGDKQRLEHCRQLSLTHRTLPGSFQEMKCPCPIWKLAESQQRSWWEELRGLSQPQTACRAVPNRTQQKGRHLFHINFSILTSCTLPSSQLLLHAPSRRWKSFLPLSAPVCSQGGTTALQSRLGR